MSVPSSTSRAAFPTPPPGGATMTPQEQQSFRLEHFLDTVLRKSLNDVLLQRDHLFAMAASCTHLRQLLKSCKTLQGPVPNADSKPQHSGAAPSSSPVPTLTGSSDPRMEPMSILADLGHHFFMEAKVKDPSVIHINIGCGVIVPMNHQEAEPFLAKREKSFTELAQMKTKEALKIKFRIRLVMEAISRLQVPASSAADHPIGVTLSAK